MMESQSLQRKIEEPASLSQSSEATIIESLIINLEKRIQNWMWEGISLSGLLQGISLSHKTNVRLFFEKLLREQKEAGEKALLTQFLESIMSSAEIKAGKNFRLEEQAQHSKQSNKQIYKAPETRNSSGRKGVKAYIVKAVDKPLDENTLTEASGLMPEEVRLVINSPYIRSQDLKTLEGSIRYPLQEPRFNNMFGVVQDTVGFTVKSDLRFNTYMEPFGFWCDIIYNPDSDDCHLHNRSGLDIYLISSNESLGKRKVNCGRQEPICSGAWRISIKSDETTETSCFYPIFDILVRGKSFSISADKRVTTVLGTNLFTKDPREVQYTPTSSSRTITSISKLVDGETAHIKDLRGGEWTYDLERVKTIAGSSKSKTSVFSCRHSGLPEIKLAAKVFCFKNKRLAQEQMKREMELLKQLRHRNIVSLEVADPRFFTLYLELLPSSLDKNCELESTWDDARTVLFDISSALAYLSKQKIIHYDVKPSNIAFSRDRGAVLFDFDLGDYLKPKYGRPGGTFGFLPPETIEPGKTRGFPGDVWALGVTILCIKGKPTGLWDRFMNMDDLRLPNSHTYEMVKRGLQLINLERDSLDLKDKVQNMVYKMLEPKSEARVTAAAIHLEDDRKPQGGRSAKKRKCG